MTTVVDLFEVQANDTEVLGVVIDLLVANCDTGQVEHFLADFTRWHRLQGHRASQRERDEAFIQLQQWQRYLDSLVVDERGVRG